MDPRGKRALKRPRQRWVDRVGSDLYTNARSDQRRETIEDYREA